MTRRAPLVVVLLVLSAFPAWTLQPGASVLRSEPKSTRGAFSAQVSWELESPQAWAQYRDALRTTAPDGYELRQSATDQLRFVQPLSADILQLEVQPLSSGPLQRIGVRFTAMAW